MNAKTDDLEPDLTTPPAKKNDRSISNMGQIHGFSVNPNSGQDPLTNQFKQNQSKFNNQIENEIVSDRCISDIDSQVQNRNNGDGKLKTPSTDIGDLSRKNDQSFEHFNAYATDQILTNLNDNNSVNQYPSL